MLVQPLFVMLVFITVRCGDIAITAGMARQYVHAIIYGIVAVLALVAAIIYALGAKA